VRKFNKFWALVLTLILSFSLASPVFAADARTITLSGIEGDTVRATRGDPREFDARVGQRLGEGHTLTTGRDSFAYLQMDQESLLKMDQSSQLVVSRASRDRLSLSVESGSALVHVANMEQGHSLETRIGNTALAVRGTLYVMGRNSSGMITISMLEGSGDVDGRYLPAGYVMRIYDDGYTITPLQVEEMDRFTLQAVLDHQGMLLEIGVITPAMLEAIPALLEVYLEESVEEVYNGRSVIVQWGQRNARSNLTAGQRTAAPNRPSRQSTSRPTGSVSHPGFVPTPHPTPTPPFVPVPTPPPGGNNAPGSGDNIPDDGNTDNDLGNEYPDNDNDLGNEYPDNDNDSGGEYLDNDNDSGGEYPNNDNDANQPVLMPGISNTPGTSDDPHIISTEGHLSLIHEYMRDTGTDFRNTYFTLVSDLEFNHNVSIGHVSNTEILPFNGKFEGDGFAFVSITGLGTLTQVGLFAYIGEYGTVRNLHLKGSINAHRAVGAVAGVNRGTIQNVISEVHVTGTDNLVGGLVGINYGLIEDSFISPGPDGLTRITGSADVGGIAGQNNGTIRNTVNLAYRMEVAWDGSGANMHRIVGDNPNGELLNNFASASMLVGGFTEFGGAGGSVVVGGTVGNNQGQDVTAAQFNSQSFWEGIGFDFATDWMWDSITNLPTLQPTPVGLSSAFADSIFEEFFPYAPMTTTPSALVPNSGNSAYPNGATPYIYIPYMHEPEHYLKQD